MSEQGSKPASPKGSDPGGSKKTKSSKKKSSAKDGQVSSAGAELGQSGYVVTTVSAAVTGVSDTVSVSTPPVGVALTTSAGGAGVQPYLVGVTSQQLGGGPAFQPAALQQPFYPAQLMPQQMPFQFCQPMFQGFNQPFAYQEMADLPVPEPMEDLEEEESVDGESLAEQVEGRKVHALSEDEEEGPAVRPARVAVDFDSLKPGKMAEFLKQAHQKTVEADKVGAEVNGTLASIIGEFFDETKVASEIDRIAKDFPRVKNIKNLVVPKLDQELFTALDQNARSADIAIQLIQKSVTASISALAPLAALLMARGDTDPDLDAFSGSLMKAIQLNALASNALSVRRREMLKPSMQNTYAKAMVKAHDGSPEWLFGGNLSEVTKKCEIAKRVADKIVKRKQTQQGAAGNQQNRQAGGAKNQANKKFRFNNPGGNQNYGQKAYGYGLQNIPYQNQFQQSHYQYQAYRPRQQHYVAQGYQQQGQHSQQQQGHQQDFRPKGPRK